MGFNSFGYGASPYASGSTMGGGYGMGMGMSQPWGSSFGYQGSPLMPASMIRGRYNGYAMGYGAGFNVGYGGGMTGYSPFPAGNGYYGNPYFGGFGGSVPGYYYSNPGFRLGNPGINRPGNPGINRPVNPVTSPDKTSPVDSIREIKPDTGEDYEYTVTHVGEVARAPMAMFDNNGELVISIISRNGINYTPVYSYTPGEGVRERQRLPESAESGHYGYTAGGQIHLTPESDRGMIDFTATDLDSGWTKHDYTHLNPHKYKNLKWGASYRCPVTGREFMGFGNNDKPGVVLNYNPSKGEWETFSADEDLRFPSSFGVITGGSNDGVVLVKSSQSGDTRIHAVHPDGRTERVSGIGGWGSMSVDHSKRVFYLTSGGTVRYASFDNFHEWKEARVLDEQGNDVGKMDGGDGQAKVHPKNGRMIFSALHKGDGNTSFYESREVDGEIVLKKVYQLDGAGEWAGKMAVVGTDLYFGTGMDTGKAADRTPGGIFRLDLA